MCSFWELWDYPPPVVIEEMQFRARAKSFAPVFEQTGPLVCLCKELTAILLFVYGDRAMETKGEKFFGDGGGQQR